MATKTPIDPRDTPHGEEEVRPIFGDQSSRASPGDAQRMQGNYDSSGLDTTPAGDPTDPRGAVRPKELKRAEEAGGGTDRGTVGNREAGLFDPLGKGFAAGLKDAAVGTSGVGRFARLVGFFKHRKKQTIGGSIAGVIIISAFVGFGIIQGPLQVIHLGEILGKSLSNQDNASDLRMRGLVRWARTGDFGETRLGAMQSQINKRATAKLEKNGVVFGRDRITGQLAGLRIDHQKNPDYRNLSEEKARLQIAKVNGLTPVASS